MLKKKFTKPFLLMVAMYMHIHYYILTYEYYIVIHITLAIH